MKPADREQLSGQVLAVVDASVHGNKSLQSGFVFHVGVVETRVEHDDGKREDVAGVCNRKPQFSFLHHLLECTHYKHQLTAA